MIQSLLFSATRWGTTTSFSRRVLPVVIAALAGCSGGEATAPIVKPASVEVGQAAAPTATVGTALAVAPTFIVKDANGSALAGVDVSVAVTSGGGTLVSAPTKSLGGPTSVGTWTLGTTAGSNGLTVTVAGLAATAITATGTADVPATIVVTSGNNQRAPAASQVPQPIAVKVSDKHGNGVPNTAVNFSVRAGLGLLQGSGSVSSDASGGATAPSWTLGKSNVPQSLQVLAGQTRATDDANIATDYVLDVRFFGPAVDPGITQAFASAAARISAEVTGGVQRVPFDPQPFDLTQCPIPITGLAPLSEIVPGVIIYATVTPIDGAGKVVGSAGPCLIRSSTTLVGKRLTIVGVMKFDVADLQTIFADGRLNDVILHEMHHVLGFGTLWDYVTPNLIVNAGTDSTAFRGTAGIQGCIGAGGGQGICLPNVLLENKGGAGTIDGHWREAVFRTELMTGFVSAPGVPNPLSQMTIGSMADLGYVVNANVQDADSVPSAVSFQFGQLRTAEGLGGTEFVEQLLQAVAEVTSSGHVTPIKQERK